mmetsp:Transcript_53086/g.153099  ORF Transcript_53086/g.153099 Transcript_53086/m.153099 type:complete len:290 (+) Transcript_53086:860-1729(+)
MNMSTMAQTRERKVQTMEKIKVRKARTKRTTRTTRKTRTKRIVLSKRMTRMVFALASTFEPPCAAWETTKSKVISAKENMTTEVSNQFHDQLGPHKNRRPCAANLSNTSTRKAKVYPALKMPKTIGGFSPTAATFAWYCTCAPTKSELLTITAAQKSSNLRLFTHLASFVQGAGCPTDRCDGLSVVASSPFVSDSKVALLYLTCSSKDGVQVMTRSRRRATLTTSLPSDGIMAGTPPTPDMNEWPATGTEVSTIEMSAALAGWGSRCGAHPGPETKGGHVLCDGAGDSH